MSPPSPSDGSDQQQALIAAEMGSLGAMIQQHEVAVDLLGVLDGDYFSVTAHRHVFEAIRDLVNDGHGVDEITVLGQLRTNQTLTDAGGPAAIGELVTACPSPANARSYAHQVLDEHLRRTVIQLGNTVAAEAQSADHVRAVLDDLSARIHHLQEDTTGDDDPPLGESLAQVFELVEDVQGSDDELMGVATGLPALDQALLGLWPGRLYTIAARPGLGKSIVTLNMALNVARTGKQVLLVSTEMSREELTMRALSESSAVPHKKMMSPHQLTDDDWKRLSDAFGDLAGLPLRFSESTDLPTIRSKAVSRATSDGLDLLIIDYVQQVQAGKRFDTRREEVDHITRQTKVLARNELNIPVIQVAQLGRRLTERSDKRPVLSDLRESGSLENDSDVVIGLHRDDYYEQGESDTLGEIELLLMKNRWGSDGLVRAAFIPECCRVRPLPNSGAASGPATPPDGKPPPGFPTGHQAPF